MPKKIDLTGQRFGRWTVLYEAPRRYDSRGYPVRRWHVICDCENHTEKDIDQYNLTSGQSTSCGCYQREKVYNRDHMDLTNKRYGHWVVLYEIDPIIRGDKSIDRRWHCMCDCGKEKDVLQRNLVYGVSTSCGCSYSKKNKPNYLQRKTNKYDLSGDIGQGWDCNDNIFYFDLEDYELIKNYCWHVTSAGYVVAPKRVNEKYNIYMHRLVLNLDDEDRYKIVPDHINGNKNDNRKSNLRIASATQNKYNIGTRSNSSSKVTGVCYSEEKKMWRAYINHKGKQIHLGYFKNKKDAVSARKKAEENICKEFSYDSSQIIASKNKLTNEEKENG